MSTTTSSFFSTAGRTSRLSYWKIILAAWATVLFITLATIALVSDTSLAWNIGLVGTIVPLALTVFTRIRRLHDRNRSGWWIFPLVLIPAAINVAISETTDHAHRGIFLTAIGLVASGFAIWGFIEIGCLKGTDGPNRFGADPLSPSPGTPEGLPQKQKAPS